MITTPARKVRLRYNGVSGDYPSLKNGRMMAFESLLERDFMLLLEFDHRVLAFCEQPLTIPYTIPAELTKNKKPRVSRYTPDVLVYYKPEVERLPELIEVKSQRDLIRYKDEFAPKFAAAESFARGEGYRFRTVTNLDMSPERIANANDLYRDLRTPRQEQFENSVGFLVKNVCGGSATGRRVYEQFGHHDDFVAKLRLLIALGRLITDWDEAISLDSSFEWGQETLAWERAQ